MSKLVAVRMVRPMGAYNAGEVCGWPADKASQLIASKYAVPFAERASVTKTVEPVLDEVPTAETETPKPARKKRKKRRSKKTS